MPAVRRWQVNETILQKPPIDTPCERIQVEPDILEVVDRHLPDRGVLDVGALLRGDAHEVRGGAARVGLRGRADSWLPLRGAGVDVSRGSTGRSVGERNGCRGSCRRGASVRPLHRRRLVGQASS